MKLFFIPRLPKDKGFTPHQIGAGFTPHQIGAGFTLVEVIFTISILALVLVAMTPFIRTVYLAWNLGDRKTEMQQNGRVGLETMSRLLRQAKRITAIPSTGSGNFVRFRNTDDNQTIIFYHNIPTSTYYYNNTTSLIRDNDLVMRNITTAAVTNALLAKSLNNFRIDCKNSSGAIVTRPYEVSSLDITMNLSDPQGLIPDTIDIFSTLSLRPEVRINRPVWVAAGSYVIELSMDNWISGFNNPRSISITSSDGSIWVADTNNNRIKKLSSTGQLLVDLSGFLSPNSVSVNSTFLVNGRETVWVADTGNNQIRRIYWSDSAWVYETITGGTGAARFSSPRSVSVNPNERINNKETCWVTDTSRNRIRRLVWTGSAWSYSVSGGATITGFSGPRSVSVNSNEVINDRNTCWVADTGGNRVRKIYWSNTSSSYRYNTLSMGGGSQPISVSVNTADGTCWVANSGQSAANGNRIRKLSSSGTILLNLAGFNSPNFVSVNPTTGECWVADTGNNQVVKLDAAGNEEFRISGFTNPLSVASSP